MGIIEELKRTTEYVAIASDVENFVKEKLEGYSTSGIEAKTIHDPVWGSVEYKDWEMQIIDSPLLQRLRDINQVGLAMLTYPAARHSRFEHSLGVTAAAKKMCERINLNSGTFRIPPQAENSIYLAALLHDVGHCFYSHLSETIYGSLEEFMALRTQFNTILKRKPKPHEILSFIIVNTEAFKTYFFENVDYPEKSAVEDTLLPNVGKMIIGLDVENTDGAIESYRTAIINGPFDADKLDYIKRDSLTAGLTLAYDIERLFTKILVHTISNDNKVEHRLVVRFNGVTAIEELTFCKIMLFSYIYYHQKVLVSESLVKDYIYALYELGVIDCFADFLKYTDSEILMLAEKQAGRQPFPEYGQIDLVELSKRIKERRLPKRCFEVAQTSLERVDDTPRETEFERLAKVLFEKVRSNPSYSLDSFEKDVALLSSAKMKVNEVLLDELINDLRDIPFTDMLVKRKEFYSRLVKAYKRERKAVTFTMFDVHLIFPNLVNYGSIISEVILPRDNGNPMTINDFVKLDDWAGSFNSNKWRGYVFVTSNIDRNLAFQEAQEFVLGGKARLKNPAAYLKGVHIN